MKKLMALLFFCHVASSVKHSLKYILTATSGVPDFPEFMGSALVDEVQVGYYDSSTRIVDLKLDWVRKFMKDNPRNLERYVKEWSRSQHVLRADIDSVTNSLNQTEGVHILQRMNGCEWDDETGDIRAFNQYGYDGEDFIALDLQTLTWIAQKPQAFITKLRWDNDETRQEYNKNFFINQCPNWLKKYVHNGKSFLHRTDLPSVSLLQKTPSSLVTCLATGFYPDRADLFWTKDGEELREDVDKGEILPNHDGTFQMSVDLNISSITPEDWRKYECVFQLTGFTFTINNKLDEAAIRTNWDSPSGSPAGAVIGVVVSLPLMLLMLWLRLWLWKQLCITGFRHANTSDSTDRILILTDHNSQ